MKIALIEPYISKDDASLRRYAFKNEPAHLVGMYNLARMAGSDADIIDAYSNKIPESDLVKKILDGGFTHIGFTVYDVDTCLMYIQRVINNLPDNIRVIIGGPGATYSTERMCNFFNPNWIIKGDGERALYELVTKELKSELLSESSKRDRRDKCEILEFHPMSLDEIPFVRPYSLSFYEYEASMVFQRGCIGKCIFCSGAYQDKISYMSSKKAVELMEYLVSTKKASSISTLGPDFTASANEANGIIKNLGNISFPKNFRFIVRLDTFYECLKDNPYIWTHLCNKTDVLFETSIESFSIERLKKLGKNVERDFVENMIGIIDYILETCNCKIILSRIALDPTINMDQFIYDNKKYMEILKAHPMDVTIGQHTIVNKFMPVRGSPSMALAGNDNPWSKYNLFQDAAVSVLNEQLLEDSSFKSWCSKIEKIDDFGERNFMFVEILQMLNNAAKNLL